MTQLAALVAACGGAAVAHRVRLPGGLMVGAMLAAGGATLALDGSPLPDSVTRAVFVAVGILLGLLVNRRSLLALRPVLLPAVFCGSALILTGIGSALVLRALDIAPLGDVLATSPGALSVLSAAAADADLDAPTVALFHLTRLLVILLTLPLLLRLLPPSDERGRAESASPAGPIDHGVSATVPHPTRLTSIAQGAMVLLGATLGAAAAALIGIGGALIFGATVGTAVVAVSLPRPLSSPAWFATSVQVGVGWMIGSLFTPQSVAALPTSILPAMLAAMLAIAAGIGLAFLLRAQGIHLAGDVLATSPGALESLSVIAIERGVGPLQVAVFHTLRILLVLVSLPVLMALVPALR